MIFLVFLSIPLHYLHIEIVLFFNPVSSSFLYLTTFFNTYNMMLNSGVVILKMSLGFPIKEDAGFRLTKIDYNDRQIDR